MPTMGEISGADLCGCSFVKGKSAALIVDEHGLDDGMSKPGEKTRQGHRPTRTGADEEIRQHKHWEPARRCECGSAGIGSLHADANSAARSKLAGEFGSAQQLVQVKGIDLARSKTWAKDCPRQAYDSTV